MTVAATALLAWGATYASVAAWALARPRVARARPGAPLDAGRVLLVRPCAGDEPELEATLRSSGIDADPALVVRFAVATDDDPAARPANGVARELRERGFDARAVVTGARAANRKADQIARVLDGAPEREIVVVADSDVLFARGDLAGVVSPLRDPRVGVSWSAPVPSGRPHTFGDRLEAAVLGGTFHAFTVLSAIDHGGAVGKLIAVRRTRLDAMGGFASLVGWLGEDVELARRARRLGDAVVVSGVARARPRARTPKGAFDRLSRWLLVVRGQRPWLLASYPLLFFSAVPAAIASAFAGGREGGVAAALFVLARLSIAAWAVPAANRDRAAAGTIGLALLADGLIAAAFFRALATPRTIWRGASLRIVRGGRLQLEEEAR